MSPQSILECVGDVLPVGSWSVCIKVEIVNPEIHQSKSGLLFPFTVPVSDPTASLFPLTGSPRTRKKTNFSGLRRGKAGMWHHSVLTVHLSVPSLVRLQGNTLRDIQRKTGRCFMSFCVWLLPKNYFFVSDCVDTSLLLVLHNILKQWFSTFFCVSPWTILQCHKYSFISLLGSRKLESGLKLAACLSHLSTFAS